MERHRARGTTLLWRFWWSIPGPAPQIVALGQTITAQYDAQAIRKSGVFSDSGAAEGHHMLIFFMFIYSTLDFCGGVVVS
jgi:hypothetical protein